MSTSPSIAPPPVTIMALDDGRTIAIRHRLAEAGRPTIVFLPGYASDMDGTKAVTIDEYCSTRGIGCLRFDYSGTGQSQGNFADGTLSRWLAEAMAAIDLNVLSGKAIVVGSSMGAWLALHVALRMKDKVAGVVGIAAAPDFTDWGFSAEDKQRMLDEGRIERPSPYGGASEVTHLPFWQSGETYGLLSGPVDLTCPVRLVHGDLDEEVGLDVPIKLLSVLRSSDVQLNIIKNGRHRLSEPHELHAVLMAIHNVMEMAR